ncbi:MAG TPA: FeoB-associated Cys-rich membrane protein [Prolixibacteraceae bacterium]|nr:FeoB-associated Cys-rich membrane protein [Prolixibacteraceae bacterium]
MFQEILVLIIVALVVIKTIHSIYKSVTNKEKGVCGGCASCDLKSELKKKGMLMSYAEKKASDKFNISSDALKYSARKVK